MAYLLFDIDSTLLDSSRSGMRAMLDAGRELYGEAFSTEGIEYAGRLDPLIVHDLLVRVGVEPTAESQRRFREVYRDHLARRLRVPGVARTLRGVDPLLERLRAMSGVWLGLLTGNYEETGSLKLRASGIDPEWFGVRVWGDESPHWPAKREHLPPIGIQRFGARAGVRVEAERVMIIGDTPEDVRCARVNGCGVLGVATGKYGMEELRAAGASHVVEDLSDVERVMGILLGGAMMR